jgi:hypothetical protein
MYASMRTQHHTCEEDEERDTSQTVLVTKKRGGGVAPPRTGFCMFYTVTCMTDKKLKHTCSSDGLEIMPAAAARSSAEEVSANLAFYIFFFPFFYSHILERISAGALKRNLNLILSIFEKTK